MIAHRHADRDAQAGQLAESSRHVLGAHAGAVEEVAGNQQRIDLPLDSEVDHRSKAGKAFGVTGVLTDVDVRSVEKGHQDGMNRISLALILATAFVVDLGAGTVIIATGSHFRSLGVPGESDFEGKGISHCASCDGHLFAGEAVAVIGGGDSAVEEAAVLSEHVERVVVLHPGETLEAQRYLLDAFESKPNVAVQSRTAVEEILGEGLVTGLRVRDEVSGAVREESVTGVFIFAGLAPNSAFLEGLVDLDSGGHVVVDLGLQTSVPGIFAAGDVRQHSASLVASAIGDGATAAVSAARYLRGRAGR